MGLFGDKRLLELTASSLPGGELQLQIEKSESKYPHLLPFSCIALAGSQLTVLTEQHPKSLCKRLLDFVEFPASPPEPTALVSGFSLALFEGGGTLYTKFNPLCNRSQPLVNDHLLQTGIEHVLSNYAITLFNQSDDRDRAPFRLFLLLMIRFYQMELIPIIRQINPYDLKQRKKLDNTQIFLSTLIYRKWNEPKGFASERDKFLEYLSQARRFDGYLM